MANRLRPKSSKAIYIVGAITLVIIVLLAVYLALMMSGAISVSPEKIVIMSGSVSAEYDGSPLTSDEWRILSGTLEEGHSLEVVSSGSQTEAGSSNNIIVARVHDKSGADVTNLYDIEYEYGLLEVLPRVIIVQSPSAEKKYDGTPLTAREGCELVRGELAPGHYLDYTVNGSLTSAGRADNTFTATVSDGDTDFTKNYSIRYLYGTLYVHGDMILIKTASATKQYDGTPLFAPSWTVVSGNLKEGETLEVDVIGTQVEIGESDNIASGRVYDALGNDITDRYELNFDLGKLTVTGAVFILETMSGHKVYDALPLTVNLWRVRNDDSLLNDTWAESGKPFVVGEYEIVAATVGSITDAGQIKNEIVVLSVTRGGVDVEDEVSITTELGRLTVDKRPITIVAGSSTKVYDGEELRDDTWTVANTVYGLVDGHYAEVTVSGVQVSIGISENVITEAVIYNEEGVIVTENYDLEKIAGKLTVCDENGSVNPDKDPDEEGDKRGDIDEEGKIGGDTGDPDLVAFKIKAERDGKIYLKNRSYGDYLLQSWDKAKDSAKYIKLTMTNDGTVIGSYGMNYLATEALKTTSALENTRVEIERCAISQTFLPYYLDSDDPTLPAQSGDTVYSAPGDTYAASYYPYDYAKDKGALFESVDLGRLSSEERRYREYVYENYTAIPETTLQFMNGIIAENGFADMPLHKKILAVAGYISTAAKYNLKYDKTLDTCDDIAVSFLGEYKEGICSHYATSATLLYRALGVPSRYCVGYVCSAKRDKWVEVTADKAHAWTEVYFDGVGWIMLEVTGGGFTGDDVPDINEPEKTRGTITVKPHDVDAAYKDLDGPLTYTETTLQGMSKWEKEGYTYTFTVTGEQSGVGIGISEITEFTVFDSAGEDVTDEFNIKKGEGKLHVYEFEVRLVTQSREKIYDGTPLTADPETDGEVIGTLMPGHSVGSIAFSGEQTRAGQATSAATVTIADGSGVDVTYMYKVNNEFGTLTVRPREITVRAKSATGYLTELGGEPLVCNEYELFGADGSTENVLADGDSITVLIRGSIDHVGYETNDVAAVAIFDVDGEDVTKNYNVIREEGTLMILPRRPAAGGN